MNTGTTQPHGPGPYVVRVSGDMDLEHAEDLRTALAAALARAPARSEIVVDLRNSSFCDSTGLNVLLEARQQALNLGRRLVLAAPGHQMIRMLEITSTAGLLACVPALAEREEPLGRAPAEGGARPTSTP
ncbi:STAS domain-containing protein [Streptomyces sp. NPDC048606]|uniref:STAS domain-containing protein n=1 Tax=Streptomyces sp. NPDC048606 TaxID=3154726 RepID=UPI0034358162